MEKDDEKELAILAAHIARYLQEHSHVADTIDGVINWWLASQNIHAERGMVERALRNLYAQGLINIRTLPDGKILYVSSA